MMCWTDESTKKVVDNLLSTERILGIVIVTLVQHHVVIVLELGITRGLSFTTCKIISTRRRSGATIIYGRRLVGHFPCTATTSTRRRYWRCHGDWIEKWASEVNVSLNVERWNLNVFSPRVDTQKLEYNTYWWLVRQRRKLVSDCCLNSTKRMAMTVCHTFSGWALSVVAHE